MKILIAHMVLARSVEVPFQSFCHAQKHLGFISSMKSQSNSSYQGCGVGVGVVGSRRFLDGVGVGLLRILGVGVGIFYLTPAPKVQLNYSIFQHALPVYFYLSRQFDL